MLYFATPSTQQVRDVMRQGLLGTITTPAQRKSMEGYPAWCADNGCGPGKRGIAAGYPGDAEFLSWLARHRHLTSTCHFAVAPDVVGDAKATLLRFRVFAPVIAALGFPIAFAAQDGLEALKVPWDDFQVLFIGGTTEWKLGPAAQRLAAEAKERGIGRHLGRCNTLRRLEFARAIGCTSADGTLLARGPDVNLPKLLGWLRHINGQPEMWSLSELTA